MQRAETHFSISFEFGGTQRMGIDMIRDEAELSSEPSVS